MRLDEAVQELLSQQRPLLTAPDVLTMSESVEKLDGGWMRPAPPAISSPNLRCL
jgi:hypothetical protein